MKSEMTLFILHKRNMRQSELFYATDDEKFTSKTEIYTNGLIKTLGCFNLNFILVIKLQRNVLLLFVVIVIYLYEFLIFITFKSRYSVTAIAVSYRHMGVVRNFTASKLISQYFCRV